MFRSDLQDLDHGRYWHFFTDWESAILNVDPRPSFLFFRQSTICGRRACNVTLPNLWIKCLQCGINLKWKAKAVQRQHVTSAIRRFSREGNKRAASNTTHLIRHIEKNKHSKNTSSLKQYRQRHKSNKLTDTLKRKGKYP